MKVLNINGNISEVVDNKPEEKENKKSRVIDGIVITEDILEELKEMTKEYPKTKVLLKILLGNKRTQELLGE